MTVSAFLYGISFYTHDNLLSASEITLVRFLRRTKLVEGRGVQLPTVRKGRRTQGCDTG